MSELVFPFRRSGLLGIFLSLIVRSDFIDPSISAKQVFTELQRQLVSILNHYLHSQCFALHFIYVVMVLQLNTFEFREDPHIDLS